MKITNIYPRAGTPGQTPVGNGNTIEEVFDEIRQATFDGDVVVLETHQYTIEEFHELLDKGRYAADNVQFLSLLPIRQKIHVPAQGPYEWQLVCASDGKVVGQAHKPAQPATTKEIESERYCDLSTKQHVAAFTYRFDTETKRWVKNLPRSTKIVVIWEPDVDAGDLDALPEFQRQYPDVDLVIFHRVCDKAGVTIDNDNDPENWEAEFPVMGQCELNPPEVIVDELLLKGCIHVEAGMFESYKTMGTVELCSAILNNRPAFDHFTVRKQYPILYLCPDMSPELFQEYTRPFGLMGNSDFRWQKPNGDVFHSVDSPVLQRAVQGRILVLDTMLDYAQIQKAFESGEWVEFFKKLRRLINVCGCVAIIMLVHPTKTGAKANSIDPSEYLKDSVTFGGKIDVGLAFSKLDKTSQVFVQRIKGRGFKQQQFSFTIAYLDEEGNSNLDRGRFPVYLKPGEAGRKEDHTPTSGRKSDPEKQQKIEFAKSIEGSMQTKADAVNEKFGSKHSKSTISEWLRPFDAPTGMSNE